MDVDEFRQTGRQSENNHLKQDVLVNCLQNDNPHTVNLMSLSIFSEKSIIKAFNNDVGVLGLTLSWAERFLGLEIIVQLGIVPTYVFG